MDRPQLVSNALCSSEILSTNAYHIELRYRYSPNAHIVINSFSHVSCISHRRPSLSRVRCLWTRKAKNRNACVVRAIYIHTYFLLLFYTYASAILRLCCAEFWMNPSKKSDICILHEYAQHVLRTQPQYVFQELGAFCQPGIWLY